MKKKIMLISPTALPIPAVGGGAIETLITNLLDQNEIEQQVEFIVTSKYDEEAEKIHYKHSKIYYFKGDELAQKFSLIRKIQWRLYNKTDMQFQSENRSVLAYDLGTSE